MRCGRAFAVATLLSAVGCQAAQTDLGEADTKVPDATVEAIADDLANRMTEHIKVSDAAIRFEGRGTPNQDTFEAALRAAGYTTAEKAKDAGQPLLVQHRLLTFDGQILARLSIGTVEVARGYLPTGEGARPATVLTVIKRD